MGDRLRATITYDDHGVDCLQKLRQSPKSMQKLHCSGGKVAVYDVLSHIGERKARVGLRRHGVDFVDGRERLHCTPAVSRRVVRSATIMLLTMSTQYIVPDSTSNTRACRTWDFVPAAANCFFTNRLCSLCDPVPYDGQLRTGEGWHGWVRTTLCRRLETWRERS